MVASARQAPAHEPRAILASGHSPATVRNPRAGSGLGRERGNGCPRGLAAASADVPWKSGQRRAGTEAPARIVGTAQGLRTSFRGGYSRPDSNPPHHCPPRESSESNQSSARLSGRESSRTDTIIPRFGPILMATDTARFRILPGAVPASTYVLTELHMY